MKKLPNDVEIVVKHRQETTASELLHRQRGMAPRALTLAAVMDLADAILGEPAGLPDAAAQRDRPRGTATAPAAKILPPVANSFHPRDGLRRRASDPTDRCGS